ncbi:MAG: hypothetical protein UT43_C0017G0017 [Parcubacteria group bacterium GW2011_GWC1_39_29]|uniref:Uncharacterized protein n=1 Tax=Candidatus Yanofskybacteria bacterium GW2011_GWD1_39_16 TaxID=1619030 RepID=A0A837HQ22_9BACT|nr:MAG: hypothetical protein UT35_C0002G0016 [Candidatus Yanofskybacteria bacterium GW2011_GWD1_39_16]KKR14746.1 MAG: hypothetical protein UT43_C0017G0017 [Parcubacteria group bacterium GW2011_GWC1_39_29]
MSVTLEKATKYMSSKRMFDKAIMETDNFLNISLSAKAIYFLLGMEADDEGFVSPTRILRLYGGEKGDLKNLIDTGLIIPFKSGVVVITDWHQNNWLDIRRIKPTQHQKEKKLLTLNDCRKYVLSQCLADAKPEESRVEESRVEQIAETAEWDFLKELEKLKNDKRKDLRLIAFYWKTKDWKFENKKQFNSALKRELRPAKDLVGYTGQQVAKAMKHCEQNYKEWSLETVHKRINDIIKKQ